MQLKYRIRSFLHAVPNGEYKKHKAQLIKKLGVSEQHFYKLVAIPASSTSSLTTDQLLIIADHFGCKIDDLVNKEALV